MKRLLMLIGLLWAIGCAAPPPAAQDPAQTALPLAREIVQKYRADCLSLGHPEGSHPHTNCMLKLYERESGAVARDRKLLYDALMREMRKRR